MFYFLISSLFLLFIISIPIIYYFIFQSRIPDLPTGTPMPAIIAPFQNESYFVTWSPSQGTFRLNDRAFYATGCNIPWMGLIVSDTTKCFTQPSKENIRDILSYAKTTLHCNVIRCHTLGFSAFSPDAFYPTYGQVNDKYWEIIDEIIMTVKSLGLHIIPVLTDQYNGYNGNYNIFVDPDGGETSKDIFNTKSKSFANYCTHIGRFLTHEIQGIPLKNESSIFALEFGNELGDHFGMSSPNCENDQKISCSYSSTQPAITVPHTGCPAPTKEWMEAVRDYIRTIDNNHLLMTGANWCQLSPPVQSASCDWDIDGIDIVSFHWYFCTTTDGMKFQDDSTFDTIQNACKTIRNQNKAVIFGEYPATYANITGFLPTMQTYLDQQLIQGELFWDLVYDDYLTAGADIEGDNCSARRGFAVAPQRDVELLQIYAEHLMRYEYTSLVTCKPKEELDCCQTPTPPPDTTIKILMIGDSITSGYHCSTKRIGDSGQNVCAMCGVCTDLHPDCDLSTSCMTVSHPAVGAGACPYDYNCSASIADFLGDNLRSKFNQNIEIYNYAIPGTTAIRLKDATKSCQISYGPYVDSVYNCWDQALQLDSVDLITIMFGTNDAITANLNNCFGNDRETLLNAIISELKDMIAQLQKAYPLATIFIMRPIPSDADSFLDLQLIDTDYSALSELGKIQGVTYIDLYTESKKKMTSALDHYLCDHVHPWNHFNLILANTISDYLSPKIQKKGTVASSDPTVTIVRCNTGCPDDH